jgi:hypothetical protein
MPGGAAVVGVDYAAGILVQVWEVSGRGNVQLGELLPQAALGNTEEPGSPGLHTVSFVPGGDDVLTLLRGEQHIERRGLARARRGLPQHGRQVLGTNDAVFGEQECPCEPMLELANIAGQAKASRQAIAAWLTVAVRAP